MTTEPVTRLLGGRVSGLNVLKLQRIDRNLRMSISHANVVISAKLAPVERR